MPFVARVALKKFEMLVLVIVLAVLSSAVDPVPTEAIPLTGVVAPSRTSQKSIVLLLFPVAPAEVLKSTTPPVVEVLTPWIVANLTVFREAPLMRRTATPAVAGLAIVSWEGPAPPARPSTVTFVAPFRSIVAVVLALVMLRLTAPASGRIVIGLVGEPSEPIT